MMLGLGGAHSFMLEPNPHSQVEESLNRRGKIMADDKSKAGKADRDRINVNEAYEITYWPNKLDVAREQLRGAVAAVGPMAEDIQRYLNKG
jgi:hypothetical protein